MIFIVELCMVKKYVFLGKLLNFICNFELFFFSVKVWISCLRLFSRLIFELKESGVKVKVIDCCFKIGFGKIVKFEFKECLFFFIEVMVSLLIGSFVRKLFLLL